MYGSVLKPLGALPAILIAAFTAVASPARAQAPPMMESGHSWSIDLDAAVWFVPDQSDFVLLQLYADRGALHLEARYNYEDLQTGSAWVGWTFGFDGTLSAEFTPMAGALIGNTNGLAPGLLLDLSQEDFFGIIQAEFSF